MIVGSPSETVADCPDGLNTSAGDIEPTEAVAD